MSGYKGTILSYMILSVYYIGKLYVTGGNVNRNPTNLAEVIEVANQTGTPTALPSMQVPRSEHALAAGGSRVFAFGGCGEVVRSPSDFFGTDPTSSCEYYDSRKNK